MIQESPTLMFLVLMALTQVFLLPGLIATLPLKSVKVLDKLFLSVPISMIASYALVMLLVLAGSYTQKTVVILYLTQIVGLILLFWSHRYCCLSQLHKTFSPPLVKLKIGEMFLYLVTVCLAVKFLFWIGLPHFLLNQVGTVVTDWDGVVSWGVWTQSLYSGEWPTGSWTYPQMIPALHSLILKFAGDPSLLVLVKLVPVCQVILYIGTALRLAYLLPFVDRLAVVLAIPLSFYLMKLLVDIEHITAGGADFTMAYGSVFLFFAYYLTAKAKFLEKHSIGAPFFLVIIGSLILPLTKQLGFLALFIFVVFLLLRERREKKINLITLIIIWSTLGILIVMPWYIFSLSRSSDIIWDVYFVYDNVIQTPLLQRPLRGIMMMEVNLGGWFWPLILLSIIGALRRLGILCIFLIFWFFWAFYVSYDFRNLFVVIPLLAFLASSGLAQLARFLSGPMRFLPRLNAYLLSLVEYQVTVPRLTTAGIVLISLAVSAFGLYSMRPWQLNYAWAASATKEGVLHYEKAYSLNLALYALKEERPTFKFRVGTNYKPLGLLPGLNMEHKEVHSYTLEYLRLGLREKDLSHLLVNLAPSMTDAEAKAEITRLVEMGHLELIFTKNGWSLFSIKREPLKKLK